jgi:chaperone BCS1
MDVAVVSLSSKGMDDTKLIRFLNSLPSRSVILLEDVDCLFKNDRSANTEAGGVTLSGLLNAVDGAATREGQILFMTTNHLDKIDPALIRPGRADIIIELGLATLDQLESFFQKFFPKVDPTSAKEFATSVGEKTKSPAEVQQWLMKHKANPEIAKQGRLFK